MIADSSHSGAVIDEPREKSFSASMVRGVVLRRPKLKALGAISPGENSSFALKTSSQRIIITSCVVRRQMNRIDTSEFEVAAEDVGETVLDQPRLTLSPALLQFRASVSQTARTAIQYLV